MFKRNNFGLSVSCGRCLIINLNPSRNKSKQVPLIACKRQYLNYYDKPSQRDRPLVSRGWFTNKSKGDFFIVNPRPAEVEAGAVETTATRQSTFEETCLSERLLNALRDCYGHIKVPTEIQSKAIPSILSGRNCMVAAETGCGKTLSYLLPVLEQILAWRHYQAERKPNAPSALILTPNRELANQIFNVAKPLCEELEIDPKLILGGHTKRDMASAKFEYIDLLVASFGGFSKYVTNQIYHLHNVHHLVLDEADTFLDDSFIEPLTHFMKKIKFTHRSTPVPNGCQLTMASATMPKVLPELFLEQMNEESLKRITTDNLHKILSNVPQRFLRMGKCDRPLELIKLIRLDVARRIPVMIFSNKTETCNFVTHVLNDNGLPCASFNKRVPLDVQKQNYDLFTSGELNVISCTDIGSRGLDTTRTKHVINYEFPHFIADYIHRCGRTGRVGSATNCMVTNFICSDKDVEMTQKIEETVRSNEAFERVNANIKQIIMRNMLKSGKVSMSA